MSLSQRPIRVLYVNHSAAPAGSVRSLRFLLQGFSPGAVDATVISPPGRADDEFRAAGARVLPIPAVSLYQNIAGLPVRGLRWGTVLRAFWQRRHGGVLRQALRDVNPDLVHLNDHGMFQAAQAATEAGKPVIMHVRAVADRSSAWQSRRMLRNVRDHVRRVVAIDQSVRRSIPEIEDVRVIYNPVLLPETVPAPRSAPPLVVSFLAGLADFKGVLDLLDAAVLLKDRPDLQIRLYGENRWPAAYYRSLRGRLGSWIGATPDVERELRRRIERDGLQDRVRLMGHVPAEAGVFAETDLVVFPSRLNGVGRSVLEAGVHGIPSIVSLRDRVEDIVQHEATGLIVPERDPKALAEAIARLAGDAGLRARLGASARECFRVQFDPKAVAAQMLALYREVLA